MPALLIQCLTSLIVFIQELHWPEQRLVSRHPVGVYISPLAYMNQTLYLSRPEHVGLAWFFTVVAMRSVRPL
jgi:hypothetical protein